MKVKREREIAQFCPTLRDPMDCSPPGSSIHGIFQARVLEWGAIAFSVIWVCTLQIPGGSDGKESACNVGDLGWIPGLGRSLEGGHGNPLQYSCLENPHGQTSLAGYSPWGYKESDPTEQLTTLCKLYNTGPFPSACPHTRLSIFLLVHIKYVPSSSAYLIAYLWGVSVICLEKEWTSPKDKVNNETSCPHLGSHLGCFPLCQEQLRHLWGKLGFAIAG